ncbi:Fusaric acid resistance protein-like [Kaistella treverensis]|uniref:Fusaric acid resistance protein-like n=1 Tax=Kaistella treverensis TaxID=631455 RepID=A0A1I3K583_9FLAO|nr:FUSC family protein [Kaistella treverensis]SFI67669.1 Fusaric acid resistance protein-like [Kaistella treverensis]
MSPITGFRNFVFSPIIIYIFRCWVGFTIGFWLMKQFPNFDLFWALLSIMLVISPEGKDSPRLTMERVKANLIGALSAFVVIAVPVDIFYRILVGILIAALLCNLFNLLNVSRTAVVAIIIILIEKPNDGFMASIDRFLSVLVGCTIGLLVVIFTGSMAKFLHKNILKIGDRVNDES